MTDEANDSNKGSGSIVTMVILVILVALAVAAVIFWYARTETAVMPELVPLTQPVVIPEPDLATYQPEAPIVYEAPVPVVPVEPLPGLNESDASVLAALQGLSTQTLKFAVPKEIIRKFVRAINAIEEGKVVHEYRPIISPANAFVAESLGAATASQPEQYRLTAENFRRYDDYVTLLAMLDTDAVLALYHRFYPLLEEAYAEMGVKKGNFHSVFVGAIDNLLMAPIVEGELLLVRPKVFYQYADPELEKLPPTHKLLLRMGPENTRSIQTSLKKLRIKLTQ